MWATALCNCPLSVEGIGYYKIPNNIWPFFFLKKLNSFDEDDFFICAEVEYAKCFSPVKRRQVNCNVFWQQLENFERIVNFCAYIYSNTNLFCENSRLNSANFTKRVLFLRWFLTIFPRVQKYFTQLPFVWIPHL